MLWSNRMEFHLGVSELNFGQTSFSVVVRMAEHLQYVSLKIFTDVSQEQERNDGPEVHGVILLSRPRSRQDLFPPAGLQQSHHTQCCEIHLGHRPKQERAEPRIPISHSIQSFPVTSLTQALPHCFLCPKLSGSTSTPGSLQLLLFC